MAAKEPLKKIPSTAANATTRVLKGASAAIHLRAHSAFAFTLGMGFYSPKHVCLFFLIWDVGFN